MAKTSSFIDDANDPARVVQIIKDAAKYVAGQDTNYFDTSGWCGLPIDTYNAASYRMNIQFSDDTGTTSEEVPSKGLFKKNKTTTTQKITGDVEISLEVIMTDGTWSDPKETGTTTTMPAEKFIELTPSSFFTNIVKVLHEKMLSWTKAEDAAKNEGKTVKDILNKVVKDGKSVFKGLSSYNIAKQIITACANPSDPKELVGTIWYPTKKERSDIKAEKEARIKDAIESVGRSIDQDSEEMRNWLNKLIGKNDTIEYDEFIKIFRKKFGKKSGTDMPSASSDDIINAKKPTKKKLPIPADSAEELVDILKRAKADEKYKANFIKALATLVPEVKDTDGNADDILVNALLKYFKMK